MYNFVDTQVLCPIKRKANAQAKSADAHIAFLPTLGQSNRQGKINFEPWEIERI